MAKGVQEVKDALRAMRTGGSFDAVKEAMARAKFDPVPLHSYPENLVDDVYQESDSFRDVIQAAYLQRILTKEQYQELKGMAG